MGCSGQESVGTGDKDILIKAWSPAKVIKEPLLVDRICTEASSLARVALTLFFHPSFLPSEQTACR